MLLQSTYNFFRKKILIFYCFGLFFLNYQNTLAEIIYKPKKNDSITIGRITKLPLPRFVTLRNDTTYMRNGPGKEYALLWVYKKKGFPIEIIDEYDQWRRVRDIYGSEGWIHQSVLSVRRMVITLEGRHNIYENSDSVSKIIAKIDGDIIVEPKKCTNYYCYVTHTDISGWLEKSALYGIYDDEKL